MKKQFKRTSHFKMAPFFIFLDFCRLWRAIVGLHFNPLKKSAIMLMNFLLPFRKSKQN